MKTLDLIQGSPEWLAHRASHFNASDAPAMMGCSPYKTRAELLREMHSGVPAEVDIATQRRFDNGHRAEALARPLAEDIIGDGLFAVTGTKGKLSASFDGLTLGDELAFEHKALNDTLKAAFAAIAALGPTSDAEPGRLLPIYHRVQMEQQLHVSGAERALFMASEWDAEGNLIEEHHVWYYPDAELRAHVLRGWEQFERDLAAYVPPEPAAPAAVGRAPDQLPALRIEVTGAVTASNLAEFKQTALTAIRSVNRELQTDQDFADAERAVKWCGEVESRLAAAKEHALSQTSSIDELFKAIDDISAEARRVRLDLDKLVTRRKVEVKDAEVLKAREALALHLEAVNVEIAPARLAHSVEFGAAIKGLKTIDSVRAKLDAAVAQAKIEVDGRAREIRANLATFKAAAVGFEFLFPDLAQLVHKAADDFRTLVGARIGEHKAAEEAKARAKADAEQRRMAEEAARAAAAAAVVVPPPAPAVAPVAAPVAQIAPIVSQTAPIVPRADEPATLKLGDINARLAPVKLDAAGLAELGIKPAKVEGAAKLYRESQFAALCFKLIEHISGVRDEMRAEAA